MTETQAAELYRRAGFDSPFSLPTTVRAHKFNAKKKTLDGITFDSTSEANAYTVLKMWERAGLIDKLVLQPRFVLQEKQKGMREIAYVADFSYIPHGAERRIVADVKGVQTPAFRIKAKLFRAKFPDLDLQVWDRGKVKEMTRA